MKKRILTIFATGIIMLWSVSAFAATYSFDYLFSGTTELNGVEETLVNAPVNLTFDSEAQYAFAATSGTGVESYFIPFSNSNYNGFSLSLDGANLLNMLDFNYQTFAQVDLVNGVLNNLDVFLNYVQQDIMQYTRAQIDLQMDPTSLVGFFDFGLTNNWTGEELASAGSISGTLTAPTPLPGAAILLGSGLLGLVGLRRRSRD